MQDVYDAIVAQDGGVHHPHQVRRHSSPAEGIFRKLQQQVISKLYNSDGLGITTKSDQSKMNPDFIAQNKEKLPTKSEALAQWEYIVRQWNNAPSVEKPHKTRNEIYQE